MFRAIQPRRAPRRSLSQNSISLSESSTSSSSSNGSYSSFLSSSSSPCSFATQIQSKLPANLPYLFTVHPSPPSSSSSSYAFSYSPSRHKHESSIEVHPSWKDLYGRPNLLVVQPRLTPEAIFRSKLAEALNLANSLEEQRGGYFDTELSENELPPHIVVQNPVAKFHRPHAGTYFGHGTMENVKLQLEALEPQRKTDAVFVNAKLSAIQQRNLEKKWGKPVLDRVALIIEIFHAHACTKEAKLQAELAALMYKKSRLVRQRALGGRYSFGITGESEVVSARGKGGGGRGFLSGAGETELELQRRRIMERRSKLLSLISEVRRNRAMHRAARKEETFNGQNSVTVAVVGYTNAGKSTLVSALSESYIYSDDRLFATLDPRLRGVLLPSGRKVFVSDTVGFITDLPVQLVEAFHATLEEVVAADLLVHVIDSSAPNLGEQRGSVMQILKQIGVSKEKLQDMIEVWNKIDLQSEEMDSCDETLVDSADDVFSITEKDHEGADYDDMEDRESDGRHDDDEDEDVGSGSWEAVEEEGDCSDDLHCEVPGDCELEGMPHVKVSAITGVGLQELLQLIDEKVEKMEQEHQSGEEGMGKGPFSKKWRPPRKADAGMER